MSDCEHIDCILEVCPGCGLDVDEFGNTVDEFEYCCSPNCGCPESRLCMARGNKLPTFKWGIKMKEDLEFYYVVLQQAGVKMVQVKGVLSSESEYTFLSTIDATVGQHVLCQIHNGVAVGQITKVLDEWNMDEVDRILGSGKEFRFILGVVDISLSNTIEQHRKDIFHTMRNSRLLEKAQKIAEAGQFNLNSMVRASREMLTHDPVKYTSPPDAPET